MNRTKGVNIKLRVGFVLLPVFLYLLFVFLFLRTRNYDISRLIFAGDKFVRADIVDKNISILSNSDGYDGQFYYRLSLNPFTKVRTAYGITIDNPPYRQQRLLYSLIVYALSGFGVYYVPIAMLLVNVIALAVIGYLGLIIALDFKMHPIWGLAFPLYTGFLFTISHNLTEICAVMFAMGGVVFVHRKHIIAAAVCFSLAVLSKETTLLIPLSLVIGYVLRQKRMVKTNQLAVYAMPAVCFIIFRIILMYTWHAPFDLQAGANVGLPFLGIMRYFAALEHFPVSIVRTAYAELVVLFITFIVASVVLLRSFVDLYIKISWVLYAVLLICLSRAVWVEDLAIFRATTEFFM